MQNRAKLCRTELSRAEPNQREPALCLHLCRNLQTVDGAPYFSNYLDILFDLYVLVTTANSPDAM